MGYKVKKIYIYQNGQEKQVRPAVYEYSYDFRNKTLAGMQSDGWIFGSTSGVTINSNGIAFNPFNYAYIKPSGLSNLLSNASKITMELHFHNAGNTRTTDSDTQFNIATNVTSNHTGYFGNCNIIGFRVYGTRLKYDTYNIPEGDYTSIVTIDFVNKTIRLVYGTIVDRSWSLTDAQIANIKTQDSLSIAGSVGAITKTMKVIIE